MNEHRKTNEYIDQQKNRQVKLGHANIQKIVAYRQHCHPDTGFDFSILTV